MCIVLEGLIALLCRHDQLVQCRLGRRSGGYGLLSEEAFKTGLNGGPDLIYKLGTLLENGKI